MGLNGAVCIERGITERDGGDLERCAFDEESLHIAVADGIGHDLMFDGDVELVAGKQGFDGFGGLVHERTGFGESAIVGGVFGADGCGKLGIIEPGNVVKESRKKGIFFDVKIYGDLIALGVEIVFDVGEEAGGDELIGSGLEGVAVNGRIQLEFGESDDLRLSKFLETVGVDFVERGGGSLGGRI
jgi:hypothetical protein